MCNAQDWCVMFSFLSFSESYECVLYSNNRPCSTCTNVTQCPSGCIGRPTFLRQRCSLPTRFPWSPSPPSSSQCTLDFASYNYATDARVFQAVPDNFLTIEFALMEHYATRASLVDSHDDFWCDAEREPTLLCLDIGAPSTLGNSVNRSTLEEGKLQNSLFIFQVQETANTTNTQLFGQTTLCNGLSVGDGVIDVFDISALLSYMFGDWKYKFLSPNPVDVRTVYRRNDVVRRCNDGRNRYEYVQDYNADVCVDVVPDDVEDVLSLAEVRRQRPRIGVQVVDRELVFDAPVYMAFVKLSCETTLCLDVSTFDDSTRFYFHGSNVAISRSLQRDTVSNLRLPLGDGVTQLTVDYALTKVYLSEHEEYEVMPRIFGITPFVIATQPSVLSRDTFLSSRRWSTFRIPGTPARLHAVFSGVPEREAYLSNEPFPYGASPTRAQVRFTRRCSSPKECHACATLLTGLNNNVAMMNGTLELLQTPVTSSCAFDVHVYSYGTTITMNYLIVTDIATYDRTTWPHFACVDRKVWTMEDHSFEPTSPPPSFQPPSSRLYFRILTAIFFGFSLFSGGVVAYYRMPISMRRCARCACRSTLQNPFHETFCSRCHWVVIHTTALSQDIPQRQFSPNFQERRS